VTQQDILAGLAEIVNEIAGIEPGEVELDKSFIDDLDLDSLTMVEVATSAEDKFGVRIPDENLKDLKTVRDAVDFIEKAGVAA
jgi:acyl carrier protein